MRASEIFNWLRKLDSGNPLSQLCDVYTYTTIIAQVLMACAHCRSSASLLLPLHTLVAMGHPVSLTKKSHSSHRFLSRVCMPRVRATTGLSIRLSARLGSLQPGGVHQSAQMGLISCCGRV